MRLRLYAALAGMMLSMCLLTPAGAQTTETTASPEFGRCPFPMPPGEIAGVTIQCGTVAVPQDRAKPKGYQVNLSFAVLKSRSQPAMPDAVIHLHGGPGGSSLLFIDENVKVFESLREKRDIVLFDQRGGGLSAPNLNCYNLIDPKNVADVKVDVPARQNATHAKMLTACADAMKAQGIDLTKYNTAENARDVLDLARALKLDKFNLTGVSYGTRLAQEILRAQPAGLRSVVLDSSLAPATRAYEDFYSKDWSVIETVLDDCAKDTVCNRRYPKLRARTSKLLARLDKTPARVMQGDTEVILSGYALMQPFIQSQDTPEVVPYLPRMFDEADRGVFDTYFAIVDGQIDKLIEPASDFSSLDPASPAGAFDQAVRDAIEQMGEDEAGAARSAYFSALGELKGRAAIRDVLNQNFETEEAHALMSLFAVLNDADLEDLYRANRILEGASRELGIFKAYECHDAYPFNDFNRFTANLKALPFVIPQEEIERQRATIQDCLFWPAGIASKQITSPVSSTTPILVLQGRYDFVTPPVWGKAVVQQFPQATYVEIGQSGHGTRVYSACAREIVVKFVDVPSETPDTRCTSGTHVQFR